ncbi:MAG: Zn-dependent hydrolase [Firmicutes bacterium]|nr:Zn-dependent hydrolase [Bacillota bacterium]
MNKATINNERMIQRIFALGELGKDAEGRRTRLAASDEDKLGRDLVASWMKEAGLRLAVDRIGNQFGIWETEENRDKGPVMTGSHIDTVINAGCYDGCYGVIASIEVTEALKKAGFKPARPIAVCAFTNEEGVRYSPDMMGSVVYAGGYPLEQALATVGVDGTALGEELKRIGYAGTEEPGFITPSAFIELHIEQGPILEAEGYELGAVEDLQGISWQEVVIEGKQNHAGTTPTSMRIDAGLAAAKVNVFLRELCNASGGKTVATVGCMEFRPNAVNVIPDRAVFTVDLRNPDENTLQAAEKALADYLEELEKTDKVRISTKRLSRFEPVLFDKSIVSLVEASAKERGLKCRRITSGAGQDAQMMARICPAAMIFVPSHNGISHNPEEFTGNRDLIAGTSVLLDVIKALSSR